MIITKFSKKNIFYLLIIISGLLFYLYYGVYKILFVDFNISGEDFTRGCFAARNFISGRPIYDMPPFVHPFAYSPPVTLMFLPFAKLSNTTAKTLWLLLGHILTGLCFWQLYRYGEKESRLRSAAAAAAVIAFSTPLYQMLFNGNINILIFFGLSLAYAGLLSGRSSFIPAVIALFSLIKVFPAILMGVFVRRRNYLYAGYFVLTIIIMAVVSFSVFGLESNITYVHQLPGMARFAGIFHTMSLTFVIKLFRPAASMHTLFFGNLAFFCVLAVSWWKASGIKEGEEARPGCLNVRRDTITSSLRHLP